MDKETLAFYDAEPGRYADMVARELGASSPQLAQFAQMLPDGARVLDFGAGPGWAAAWLTERGFAVDALDGSEGLAAEGRRRYGINIRVAPFDMLDAVEVYDGIWCSFALLHDPRKAFGGHLSRIARALTPGGAFYIGMKAGKGEARDTLGRFYFYVTEEELRGSLDAAGFDTMTVAEERVRGCAGKIEPCLHAFARRSTP